MMSKIKKFPGIRGLSGLSGDDHRATTLAEKKTGEYRLVLTEPSENDFVVEVTFLGDFASGDPVEVDAGLGRDADKSDVLSWFKNQLSFDSEVIDMLAEAGFDKYTNPRRGGYRVRGTFDASDFFDDIEDEDVAVEPSRYADPHAVVMKFLNAQRRGDTLQIGRQTFLVENAHGGTVYVTKSPGAGRKLYTLKLVAFDPIEFVVDEVSGGSGVSLNNPPVARFGLDADGKLAGLGAVLDSDLTNEDDQGARRYPTTDETILLAGLGDTEPYEPSAQDQQQPVDVNQRTCTSKRLPFEYLRFDTCITPMKFQKATKELPAISGSRDVVKLFHGSVAFTKKGREFFLVLCLNNRNVPIGITNPHTGGRESAIVDMGIVLQAVILSGATSFIVAHNHPSGDPTPSAEDLEMTKRLAKGATVLGLRFLDHIVMADDGSYRSFLDLGLMPR